MENKEGIVILGFGGHAKSVIDSLLESERYNIIGYTDNHVCKCPFKYLGTDDELKNLYQSGVRNAVLGMGYMGQSTIRDKLVSIATEIGFRFPVIIDPSAIVSNDSIIGKGTFIGKKAIINAGANIGNFCIINTGAIIEHEDIIGDYSHVSVGAILCGNVSVGHHAMIGAGTTIIQGQAIGDNCIIGANSTVLSDVKSNTKCYGVV